ncbi:hypothetical protein S40293_09880 [Stachybotrys chartarum IBT 40293]|nr:hypothetical protein S40293_09880 [Stachybotrys chartarum IBT 40293]
MYYHFAIMMLFRPFIRPRIISPTISPRDICLQAIFAIQGLVRSYSQFYTLRRTPSFVPYFVLSACITQLAISTNSTKSGSYDPIQKLTESTITLDTPDSDAISQCIVDLDEMASFCRFAKKAAYILRYLVKQCNMGVDIEGSEFPPKDSYTTFQPHLSGMYRLTPSVQAGSYSCGFRLAQARALGLPSMHTAQMTTDGTENTWFWLFPMQRLSES